MRTVAVFNPKGGAGKTTLAANVAAAWALSGHPGLAVDFDPQATLTRLLIRRDAVGGATMYEAIRPDHPEVGIAEVRAPTLIDGLGIAPAGPNLRDLRYELVTVPDREQVLARALSSGLGPQVEWVLIDCPPDEGPLAIAALHAADVVLAPVNMRDAESLLSLQTLKATLAPIAAHRQGRPEVAAVVRIARGPRRTATQMIEATLDQIGLPVADRYTTQSAQWENATNRRGLLVLVRPRSAESRELAELALELWTTTRPAA